MASTKTLNLEPRTLLGKKVKKLRQSQITPIHLYGPGIESQALQCDSKTLLRVLSQAGMNTPVSITISGQKDQQLAFAREIQWHPLKNEVLHVDFLRVDVGHELTAAIPITLTGESLATRGTRGTIVQQLRELEVEALPLNMPAEVTADLATLAQVDDVIRSGDIPLPANVTLVTDPEEVVVRFEITREEAVVTVEEEALVEEERAEEAPEEEG